MWSVFSFLRVQLSICLLKPKGSTCNCTVGLPALFSWQNPPISTTMLKLPKAKEIVVAARQARKARTLLLPLKVVSPCWVSLPNPGSIGLHVLHILTSKCMWRNAHQKGSQREESQSCTYVNSKPLGCPLPHPIPSWPNPNCLAVISLNAPKWRSTFQ